MATDNAELYERDFFEWTQATAAAIRRGDLCSIARDAVAEEIEDMGKRDYSEAALRAELILSHLLKWQFQPERRSASWRVTIDTQRSSLLRKFDQSPSLRKRLLDDIGAIYRDAILAAMAETQLDEAVFPEICPWSFDQLIDRRFFPE